MSNIVDMDKWRRSQTLSKQNNDDGPWISGPAKCLHCQHEWVAVAPHAALDFECPSCGLVKGVRSTLISPTDHQVFICGCGNDLFYSLDNGMLLCVLCGGAHSPEPPKCQ